MYAYVLIAGMSVNDQQCMYIFSEDYLKNHKGVTTCHRPLSTSVT